MEVPHHGDRPAALPRSLWAAVTPELEPGPRLRGHRSAEVGIVGAGFMGLAAALRLAESGAGVAVLEAARVGWGASGRNNGQIIAGLKRDPDEVQRLLGAERAARLLAFSGRAPDRVFELIARHGIACDAVRKGWIQAVHSLRVLPLVERRLRAWRELGAEVALIPAAEVAARLGTEYYPAAWYDPRGGSVNPLALVRGLARAARGAGAEIFEASPVRGIERSNGRWRMETPAGALDCECVLLCVNAYGDFSPVHGAVLPLRTAQVASAPLAPERVRTILPRGEVASDTQRLLTSFRVTPDRRLIMGGASATAGDSGPHLERHLHAAATRRFPGLGPVTWQFGWSGYLALTADHLPVIHRFGPGLYASIGCNGRGVALTIAAGEVLCALLGGGREADCVIPVRPLRRPLGFGLRQPGVALAVLVKRALDALDRLL